MRTHSWLLVVSLAFVTPILAQPTQELPSLTEKVEVRLVNVDVTVTDDSGRPVRGLTADNFEVFEDGKPQPVVGFYAIEDATVQIHQKAEQVPLDTAQEFRRKMVLMIDNNTVQRPPRDAAIEFVGRFLDNQFDESYEWSVMTVGPQVETLQPFTSEKESIRSALLRARSKPVYVQQREIDRGILSDPLRAKLRESEFETGYDFGQSARFWAREQTQRNFIATVNTARAVIQTCRAYSAAEGKKALVLVTGGMELHTTFSNYDDNKDRNILEMKRQIEQVLNTMVHEANAANFKIYVVKAGGLQNQAPQHDVANGSAGLGGTAANPFSGLGYSKSADISDVDSASLTLALQTGGRYLPSNDVRQSFEKIDDETSNFYSLAYAPLSPEDGKYHRIRVRVKKPGLYVQHREGYAALNSDQRLEQSLRAPITFSKEKGNLPVTINLGLPERTNRTRPVIPITAAMPVRSLTMFPRGDRYIGRVHVYLSIYDDKGMNVGYHHQIQDIGIPATEFQKTQAAPFRYTMKVGLKPGSYTLVVTLRDDVSDEIGSAFQDVRL